jgi:hypothetical protein
MRHDATPSATMRVLSARSLPSGFLSASATGQGPQSLRLVQEDRLLGVDQDRLASGRGSRAQDAGDLGVNRRRRRSLVEHLMTAAFRVAGAFSATRQRPRGRSRPPRPVPSGQQESRRCRPRGYPCEHERRSRPAGCRLSRKSPQAGRPACGDEQGSGHRWPDPCSELDALLRSSGGDVAEIVPERVCAHPGVDTLASQAKRERGAYGRGPAALRPEPRGLS